MIPFRSPKWKVRAINAKIIQQNKIIKRAVIEMDRVMQKAIDDLWTNYEKTGQYLEPPLNDMYEVSNDFYHRVIMGAANASQQEKKIINKNEDVLPKESKKRLSAWPTGIPRDLASLEKLFRNKINWPVVMKRSKKITDRVRTRYLQKLQRKFKIVIPKLDQGEITPQEAKKELMEAWKATKPRVELIFRTETTTYFGKTQTAYFNGDPDIIGFLFDSIKDTSSTRWCRSRHGIVYRPRTKLLTENTPACHWNCRSHLIPLANTEYNRKMLEDPNRDPELRKVEPLPPGWRQ